MACARKYFPLAAVVCCVAPALCAFPARAVEWDSGRNETLTGRRADVRHMFAQNDVIFSEPLPANADYTARAKRVMQTRTIYKNPAGISGHVSLEIHILPGGRVRNVRILSATTEEAGNLARKIVRGVRLPPPPGGKVLAQTFEITFVP